MSCPLPRKFRAPLLLAAIVFITGSQGLAAVRLPNVIGDHMVLQRGVRVPIWGWAEPGENVTVVFGGQKKNTTANEQGRWTVLLDKLPASEKPARLTVSGDRPKANPLVREDVLVGEVWFASGQSNMEMSVAGAMNAKTELSEAKHPNIRLLTVPRGSAPTPAADQSASWQPCNPLTTHRFSAVAYFFGRELHRELKVPVGLINASVGGTAIERWTPTLRGDLYNKMVAPVAPFAVRGVIWYQGETNAIQGDGMKYAAKQKALIADWRKAWGRNFSFYYVQIAPCAFSWYRGDSLQQLWRAQRVCLSIPNTGMVVTTDLVGNAIGNVHPRNKQGVGKRLALWALAKNYGRRGLVHSGPIYSRMAVRDGKAILSFDHVGGGLASRNGRPLTHFIIAGKNRKFVPANVRVGRSEGSKVDDVLIVSSPNVPQPVAVRFAWDKTARPNFINKAGLPASPFTAEMSEESAR